jgi:hypothetical protein
MIWVGRLRRDALIGVPGRSSAVQAWLSAAGGRVYKQTQFGVSNSDEGCHCEQTKPIRVGRDTPPFHCSIIPPSQSNAYRAKQSQSPDCGFRIADCGLGTDLRPFVRNKPNWHCSGMWGKSFMGEDLWLIGQAEDFGETKPILASRPDKGCCTNKPNSCHRADLEGSVPRGRIVPNKPNFGGWPVVQTEPIWPSGGQEGRGAPTGAILSNKANLPWPKGPPQRHRDHRGDPGFVGRLDFGLFLCVLRASVVSIPAKQSQSRGSDTARAVVSSVTERSCDVL